MRDQIGFSLLEVLVAATVLAVGLAGIAALLLRSVAATHWAENLTAASILADSLVSRIQLSPGQEPVFTATAAAPDTQPCLAPAFCSPGQFAANTMALWRGDVAGRLPGGTGLVCRDSSPSDGTPGSPRCDGNGMLVVKVFWHARLRMAGVTGRHTVVVGP